MNSVRSRKISCPRNKQIEEVSSTGPSSKKYWPSTTHRLTTIPIISWHWLISSFGAGCFWTAAIGTIPTQSWRARSIDMKILFVCHRLPYPPIRGGKIRPFNMIKHLSRKHSVVVASLAATQREMSEGGDLRKHCDEVIVETLPPSIRWLRASKALFTPMPSSVAYFWSSRLNKRIRKRILRTQFDVILVHCAFVASYVMDYRDCFRILDFGDLDSGKWADYAERKPYPLSLGYRLEAIKLRRYEQLLARNFNRCTVTTECEADQLRSLEVSTRYDVI